MKTKVLFRADGHSQMGLGHIIRSIALARMLKSDFQISFAIQEPPTSLKPMIKGVFQEVIQLPKTNLLREEAQYLRDNYLTGQEIVVLDGYQFKTEYQKIIRSKGCKVVCIDDIFEDHFVADAIINHAGGIKKERYSAEPYTKFFLGMDYVLLRKPFLEASRNRLLPNAQQLVFVCLGGADPKNDTLKVLQRLDRIPSVKQCYVVLGGAYQHKQQLDKFIERSRMDILTLENICSSRMVDVMRLCPIAITSPSSIALEYLAVGGELYLHPTADNQKDLFKYLTKEGLAFKFNRFPERNPELLQKSRELQKMRLDGNSDKRLVKIFRDLEYEGFCQLRKATIDDMMTYFYWANDHNTRQQSFHTSVITLSEHKHWFAKKLFSPLCYLYILEYKGEAVGQIRFDIGGHSAFISYSVAPGQRGKGLGTQLLKQGVEKFKEELGIPFKIVGLVKKENVASNKAFKTLGFEKSEKEEDSYLYALSEAV